VPIEPRRSPSKDPLDAGAARSGRTQGGISPTTRIPAIFIFWRPAVGEKHDHYDEFRSDGCFYYTGAGQYGDQQMRDANLESTANVLVEAKGSVSRDAIRHAVGQLMDYRRFADNAAKLAVLVPERARPDLLNLLATVGVAAIWPEEGRFSEV
jgi:hypothetical protein